MARRRPWLRILAAAFPLLAAAGPLGAAEDPFEVLSAEVPGRPVQVIPADLGGDCGAGSDWIAVAVSGSPPEEVRQLALFPCAAAGAATRPARMLPVPADAVGFDLAPSGGPRGVEIVFLTASGLEIHTAAAGGASRRLALPGRPPLPARTREFAHVRFVDAWNGAGPPAALVPSASGAWIVDLADGSARALPLPLLADYESTDSRPPSHPGLLTAHIAWPALAIGDDDGDGRPDLFAWNRYAIWVFRSGPDGLPAAPTREIPLRLFDLEEEIRHETTSMRAFLRDVDGDGRADLVIDSGRGTLLNSRHSTELYRNRGDGIELRDEPDVRVEVEGGFATVDLVDLDGDGRVELLQSRLTIGVLQFVRLLLTRRAEIDLHSYALGAAETAEPEPTWRDDLALRLDLGKGRIADLVPTVDGDWNGDGRRDLVFGTGGDGLAIRLGSAGERGPAFGGQVASQTLPAVGDAEVVDLDGDGLDDLLIYDRRDPAGRIWLMRNRGVLPGTAPQIRSAAP